MLHRAGLVVVNAIQLIDLLLSVSLHVIYLILYQRIQFLFFGVPSYCIFTKLSSELFFIVLEKLNFEVSSSDFIVFDLQVVLELFDDSVLFFDFFLKILKIGLVLSFLEFSKFLLIFGVLK